MPGFPTAFSSIPCSVPLPLLLVMEDFSKFGGRDFRVEGVLKIQVKSLKNTCEKIHLLIKLPIISLQACNFTNNKLLPTYFSRTLARF